MANIKRLSVDNITVKTRIETNIINAQTYEGLPTATATQSGAVMIDDITIKQNYQGQLYCTVEAEDIEYDDTDMRNHMGDQEIHLTSIQARSISNSEAHSFDADKHVTTTERENISKINAHILNSIIHLTQKNITDITLSVNHVGEVDRHVSAIDRDNLNSLSTHINNSGIHITTDEKNKIVTMSTHVSDNNVHLSASDREDINTALSLASSFPSHTSNRDIHFNQGEKAEVLKDISDNKGAISILNKLGPRIDNLALTKLDSKNHDVDKVLITDGTGNIGYHPSIGSKAISIVGHRHTREEITNFPSIPTVTNDLTHGLKSNYDTAFNHSQSGHAPSNAQANIQSDWNSGGGDSYIHNKPGSLPANGGNADTVGGKRIFVQQGQPGATQVGDVWISW